MQAEIVIAVFKSGVPASLSHGIKPADLDGRYQS